MSDLAHPFFIIIILVCFYHVYAAWYTDTPKRLYESKFFPFMPKNLPAYIVAYKAYMVGLSVWVVVMYISILVGVSGDRMIGSIAGGGLLVILAQRVVIAWFTDDYMEVYEKALYDPLIPKTPQAYHTAQKVITSSLFMIAAILLVLVVTGVILGD